MKTSLGKVNIPRRAGLCLSLLHLLFRYCLFRALDFSMMCYLICRGRLVRIASYAVSVRNGIGVSTARGRLVHSLAASAVRLLHCLNHSKSRGRLVIATCLASGHDPSAYGTLTLWNVQLLGLYSPFKAHTYAMNEWGFIGQETLVVLGKSATINKFKSRPSRVGVAMS
jgi:hypothetical protein